jgi:hypothetical protein
VTQRALLDSVGPDLAGPLLLVLAVTLTQIAPPNLISSGEAIERESVTSGNDDASALPALWRRLWPLAALALGLLVILVWIGAFAYALVRLL